MMTFQVAFEALIALVKRAYWRAPSIVRLGSLIASLHCWDTGCLNDGTRSEKSVRWAVGAVGARSGWPVSGLSHVWLADAFALRNERSSSMKTSRLRPQRNVRYRPSFELYFTGENSRNAFAPSR